LKQLKEQCNVVLNENGRLYKVLESRDIASGNRTGYDETYGLLAKVSLEEWWA
jgi:hypothetical protein